MASQDFFCNAIAKGQQQYRARAAWSRPSLPSQPRKQREAVMAGPSDQSQEKHEKRAQELQVRRAAEARL